MMIHQDQSHTTVDDGRSAVNSKCVDERTAGLSNRSGAAEGYHDGKSV
jgi:hypothetical protein